MRINWAPASVLIAVIAASTLLAILGKDAPDWLKELMAFVGPLALAFMRSVVTPLSEIPADELPTDPQIRVPR